MLYEEISVNIDFTEAPADPAFKKVELRVTIPDLRSPRPGVGQIGSLIVHGDLQDAGDVGLYLSKLSKIRFIGCEKLISIEATLQASDVGYGLSDKISTFEIHISAIKNPY